MDEIKEAYGIAVKDLRACYSDHGIIAGLHQFDDYWARDACFASFGALELGDFKIVKKMLNHFLDRISGKKYCLPKKILHRRGIKFASLVRKTALGHLFTYRSRDQNPLFVIAASNYLRKSKDIDFFKKNFPKIKNIMMDSFKHDVDRNLLLEQGFYSDWADSLRKTGEILYTNVCHYAGLKGLAYIAEVLGKKEEGREYNFLASKIKDKINTLFWNGNFYVDFVGRGGNIFSSGGNMLAVIWGIANKKQAQCINNYIKKNRLETFTLETNHPGYKWWQISPVVHLVGMSDYHNGLRWLWLGCIDVQAKQIIGEKKEAKELLEKISKKIIESGHVYEIYEQDGKPVRRPYYKSEVPFAWSAGMFVWAAKDFLREK